MNKPNRDDYEDDLLRSGIKMYANDLEKYCDELEQELFWEKEQKELHESVATELGKICDELKNQLSTYKMALVYAKRICGKGDSCYRDEQRCYIGDCTKCMQYGLSYNDIQFYLKEFGYEL